MKAAIFSFLFPQTRHNITIPRAGVRDELMSARGGKSLGGLLVSSGALKFSEYGGVRISQ